MKINTCYTVDIKSQLIVKDNEVCGSKKVDESIMKATRTVCLDALKFCTEIFLSEWDELKEYTSLMRKRRGDILIHTTKNSIAKYPGFDEQFPYMPGYMRRAIVADALGIVSSYVSNHKNWEALPVSGRGDEPVPGYPTVYELTFYDQDRRLDLSEGIISLKLYDNAGWRWHHFKVSRSDAAYIAKMADTRKLLSPVVEKSKGRYRIRFCFEEKRDLVQNENPLGYTVLSVDLGINAPASYSVMTADGSVHARGVIHLPCDEDRLERMINRKRMYQQAGKKSRCIYRMVRNANELLSIHTAKAIMETAILYSVDCIVFEYLDLGGRKYGKYRERLHMWRKCDIQDRVALQAHRLGMRISRVCAWGTSKYAFDGSGEVDRHSVYRYKHGRKVYNYSVCTFQNGKVYNCDLSAAQNIGARFFLREYARRKDCPELPKTPQRTMSTLWDVVKTYSSCSAAKV